MGPESAAIELPQVVRQYLGAWNERDAEARVRILNDIWAAEATYLESAGLADGPVLGREEMSDLIAQNQGPEATWFEARIAVDDGHQVIVATTLSADPTDTAALPALVDQIETNTGRRPKKLLADAGYASDDNLAHLAERGIDAYVATRRDRHLTKTAPAPRGRIPARLTRRERMARKLTTKKGRAEYRRRKAIVEPVFGQTKEARGFRRFHLRGRGKVTAEWHLVCAVHNLAKLFRSGQAGRVVGATRAAGLASQPAGA